MSWKALRAPQMARYLAEDFSILIRLPRRLRVIRKRRDVLH